MEAAAGPGFVNSKVAIEQAQVLQPGNWICLDIGDSNHPK